METILRESYPAPRMVLVSSTAKVQYFITAEGEVLGEYPSFQDTLFFVFASYYVYHLKYPSQVKNIFYSYKILLYVTQTLTIVVAHT